MTGKSEFENVGRRALVCAAFAPLAVWADYQYIVSGWPVANESRSASSDSVGLATGTLATLTDAAPPRSARPHVVRVRRSRVARVGIHADYPITQRQ